MCGRYTLAKPTRIGDRFQISFVDFHETKIPPRFNIAPGQQVLVVVERPEGRALMPMHWGFRPAWLKQPKGPPPINARAETLLERPMFRGAVANGRCIIPADGFYEWAVTGGGKTKQPMHIRLTDGELFGFAGLWTRSSDDEPTCAIVTTAANEVMAPFHPRMPVILDPEREAAWLDSSLVDPREALAQLEVVPPERMQVYPVASLVSSVGNDGPELVEPVSPAAPVEPADPADQLSLDLES